LQNPYEFNWNLKNSKLNRLCWTEWIGDKIIEPKNIKKKDLKKKNEEEKANN